MIRPKNLLLVLLVLLVSAVSLLVVDRFVVANGISARLFPQKCNILIIGDSISMLHPMVKPTDPKIDGYALRAAKKLKDCQFMTHGFRGKTTLEILDRLKHELITRPGLRTEFEQADVIVFEAGLNDYWNKISPRALALRMRAVVMAMHGLRANPQDHVPIVFATIILPANAGHRAWSHEANNILLSKTLKGLRPGPLFDRLEKSHLSEDGLHPTVEGYELLSRLLVSFLCTTNEHGVRERIHSNYC